jgi:hypothetical protein
MTLVEQFIQCPAFSPVGSLVELNTGDVAVVIGITKSAASSQKWLILDPEKKAYLNPGILDLILDPFAFGDTPFKSAAPCTGHMASTRGNTICRS